MPPNKLPLPLHWPPLPLPNPLPHDPSAQPLSQEPSAQPVPQLPSPQVVVSALARNLAAKLRTGVITGTAIRPLAWPVWQVPSEQEPSEQAGLSQPAVLLVPLLAGALSQSAAESQPAAESQLVGVATTWGATAVVQLVQMWAWQPMVPAPAIRAVANVKNSRMAPSSFVFAGSIGPTP